MHHAPPNDMVDPGLVVVNTKRCSSVQVTDRSCADALPLCASERSLSLYDAAFVGLALFTLVHSTEALAGDQAQAPGVEYPEAGAARQLMQVSSWMSPVPDLFHAIDPPQTATYPSAEFRPRKHSSAQAGEVSRPVDDESIMRSTSVWDRLAQSRSRDGVQLVTLWQTGGNSLSIQASRKGDPTLQWTSRLMYRDGGPHGLLDDVLSTTLGSAAGRGMHILSRAPGIDAWTKPAKPADAGIGVAGNER